MKTFTSPITTPVTTGVDGADVRTANADGGDGSVIDAALRALTSAGIGFEVLFETDATGLAA